MAISDYKNGFSKESDRKRKLREIHEKQSKLRRERNKLSYAMHTPKEAMRRLEQRARSRY